MRIILATDGSEYSRTAARYVQRLGFGPETQIDILHVFKEYVMPDEIDAARDFKEVSKRGAEALIDDFREELMPTSARLVPMLREGEPWREIVEASAHTGADLVVMGHKGLHGIKEFLLGSTLHQVVRHCSASVLAVRALPPHNRPMRVLHCTNGTETSKSARALFMSLPFLSDTEVDIISVVDMELSSMPERYYPQEEMSVMMSELRDHSRKLAEKAVDEAGAELMGRFDKVRKHVTFGIPEAEVLNMAGNVNADLIVMGCKEHHGLYGAILGSEAYRIVKHANCSVLVGKSCP